MCCRVFFNFPSFLNAGFIRVYVMGNKRQFLCGTVIASYGNCLFVKTVWLSEWIAGRVFLQSKSKTDLKLRRTKMSFALAAGVTGVQAHQKMLDVAGNNLANINTIGFKANRIIFSELLAETIKKASQPTSTVGGTNPQQMGSGVGVAGISADMSQGNIINTGNPLDLALEGDGYFVLSDGAQNLYTRAGALTVDANSNLVDPSTGYIIQRIGSTGESDGFQTTGNSNVKIPYDVAIAANATTEVKVDGNLSADDTLPSIQTNIMKSNIAYLTTSGTIASGSTELDELSQFTGNGDPAAGTISVSGFNHEGNALVAGGGTLDLVIDGTTTLDDLVAHINAVLSDAANQNDDASVNVATLSNGRIMITDGASGYSKTDIKLSYAPAGNETLDMPSYFEISTVGGEEVKNANIIVYDSQGGSHVLSTAFVRTETANTWDMVLTAITGDVDDIDITGLSDRRINGLEFSGTGTYTGLSSSSESAQFKITFAYDTLNPQTIAMDFGTIGQLDGLTQFADSSTAVMNEQDGYASGSLSSVSVSNTGDIIGSFSNGIKKTIATLQIGIFKNPAGLESVGNGYFIPSVNSGNAVATEAMVGSAGSIHSGALEKSNADVAEMFVQMIEAQNGYHANARTIKIANEMLRELTNIIR
jgi:flagellar hook protein FlgE